MNKTLKNLEFNDRAWVIAVDMGYGHQRAAYALKHLAFEGKVINVDNYEGMLEKDRRIWESGRGFFEFISRFRRIPIIGQIFFELQDKFVQGNPSFYPKKDLSKPNFQARQTFYFIKKGWGRHLIEKLIHLTGSGLPLITTFFTPAFMAEFFNYPGEIFCVICDAAISRSWVSMNPATSKIKYLTPTLRAVERLKLYGVKPENIYLTGFPLPLENTGSEKLEILKHDLSHRVLNLDPQKKYFQYYEPLIKKYLGELPRESNHLLTLMFPVGGAGAQKEIGFEIIKSLAKKIKAGEMKLILVAGIREEVKEYFLEKIKNLGLEDKIGKNIEIIFAKDIESYFQEFNQALRTTDILWTKPSELSLYTALGLPIVIAPTMGTQEKFNKEWLLELGSGIVQKSPKYADQWLFDWLEKGYLAELAMQGFIEGEKLGTFNIRKICLG